MVNLVIYHTKQHRLMAQLLTWRPESVRMRVSSRPSACKISLNTCASAFLTALLHSSLLAPSQYQRWAEGPALQLFHDGDHAHCQSQQHEVSKLAMELDLWAQDATHNTHQQPGSSLPWG